MGDGNDPRKALLNLGTHEKEQAIFSLTIDTNTQEIIYKSDLGNIQHRQPYDDWPKTTYKTFVIFQYYRSEIGLHEREVRVDVVLVFRVTGAQYKMKESFVKTQGEGGVIRDYFFDHL